MQDNVMIMVTWIISLQHLLCFHNNSPVDSTSCHSLISFSVNVLSMWVDNQTGAIGIRTALMITLLCTQSLFSPVDSTPCHSLISFLVNVLSMWVGNRTGAIGIRMAVMITLLCIPSLFLMWKRSRTMWWYWRHGWHRCNICSVICLLILHLATRSYHSR